ncbi:tc1-mariner class transposase [Moniliophthora roreri]|nr:tc1-mariner class transposase [Moniliophthora roreri]
MIQGHILMYLPPYSSDFNPIKESFSCIKGFLHQNWTTFQESKHPEQELIEACRIAVMPEKATGQIRHSEYCMD